MVAFKEDRVRVLYTLACAEGEGWGTAYEYLVKINLIHRLLKGKKVHTLLIAGLPEKYGYSLDFLFIARHYRSNVVVLDEREERLELFSELLGRLNDAQLLRFPQITCKKIDTWNELGTVPVFDLVLSSCVLQRLPREQRYPYIDILSQKASSILIFVPNGGNKAHETFTGLKVIERRELKEYSEKIHGGTKDKTIKALDMPPFPPGIYKPGVWKHRNMHEMAFVLKLWCYIEAILPEFIKNKFSHMLSLSILH